MSNSNVVAENELKVWATVGHGFKFALASYIPMVLKVLVWLILGTAIISWSLYSAPAFTQEDVDQATPAFWANMTHTMLYSLPYLFAALPIYVAGILFYFKHPDGKGIYLRFGGREWRLIGVSIIIFILILLILLIVTAAYGGAIWALLTYVIDTGVTWEQLETYAQNSNKEATLDPVFLSIVGLGFIAWMISSVWAIIWAAMRFALVEFDVVLMNKIRIGYGWSITVDKAGSIFLITLVYMFLLGVIGVGLAYGLAQFVEADTQGYVTYIFLGEPVEVLNNPNLKAAVSAAAISQLAYLFVYQWSIGTYGRVYNILRPDQPNTVEN